MYNQFLSQQTFSPIAGPDTSVKQSEPQPCAPPPSDPLRELTGSVQGMLGGMFPHFSMEKLDTGDILLVLILLFLFLEGDNLELVITLGLMLLLGLGEE